MAARVPASVPLPALCDRANDRFATRFGAPPVWVAAAPGRVNLIGEHTDYNEGLVLPMAIDRWAVVTARAARGPGSRLHSIDLDQTVPVDPEPSEPAESPGWSDGIAAVLRRFAQRAGDLPALDIAVTGSVPRGAGLSSSAAVEVATATMLEGVTGVQMTALEKANLCRDAEHDAGVPCGIMDMFVAARAEAGAALLIDCRTNEARPVPLPRADVFTVLVADTGVHRALAAGTYAERRATCERAAAILGVPALRDADDTMIGAAALSAVERRRVRHVVEENARVRRAVESLESADLRAFGALLIESHDSLRHLYEVSCPELDTIVETARRLLDDGIHGARMTGAGFGGCAIVVCRGDAVGRARDAITSAFRNAHGRDPDIFEVRAVGAGAGIE